MVGKLGSGREGRNWKRGGGGKGREEQVGQVLG